MACRRRRGAREDARRRRCRRSASRDLIFGKASRDDDDASDDADAASNAVATTTPSDASPSPSSLESSFPHDERGVRFAIGDAFYRRESAQARDLAVLLSRTLASPPRVLDAMSGCGVRAARYLTQGNVAFVHANDANPAVTRTIRANIESAVRAADADADDDARAAATATRRQHAVTCEDARDVFAASASKSAFDVVDVDSFGSADFVDAALRCVRAPGHLYLTSSDGLALSGKNPARCAAAYSGAAIAPNVPGVNEHGLRVLIGHAVRVARDRGLRATPAFSLFHPHGPLFRVMLRIEREVEGTGDEDEENGGGADVTLLRTEDDDKVGWIGQCARCGDARVVRADERLGADSAPCRRCAAAGAGAEAPPLAISGPMWLGPLHDRATVDAMRREAEISSWATTGDADEDKAARGKTKRQLSLSRLLDAFALESDARLPPFHHRTDELTRRGRCVSASVSGGHVGDARGFDRGRGRGRGAPPIDRWVEALRDLGRVACRTHVDPRGLATDAGLDDIAVAAARAWEGRGGRGGQKKTRRVSR